MDIIIQARMASKRLPGKSLKKLGKITILEHVLKRVKASKQVKRIFVATSKMKKDDAIYILCKKKKINCYRGSLNNVLSRYVEIVKRYKIKSFTRICADSPFIDPNLISKFISIYKKSNYDLVTNVYPRSFPKGQSIEIFKSSFFLKYAKKIKKRYDMEHVTTFFYNRKELNIKNIKNNFDYSKISLCIDNLKDFNRARKFVNTFNYKKSDSWKKIVNNY
tara:strand:+ start:2056 stop:2715 length:660 start_codon:yes stop_codon:yes gene_type:complete